MFVSADRTDCPDFLVHQSWGQDVPTGPVASGQPDWTFWISPTEMAAILVESDSWALSGSKGFAQQGLPRELREYR